MGCGVVVFLSGCIGNPFAQIGAGYVITAKIVEASTGGPLLGISVDVAVFDADGLVVEESHSFFENSAGWFDTDYAETGEFKTILETDVDAWMPQDPLRTLHVAQPPVPTRVVLSMQWETGFQEISVDVSEDMISRDRTYYNVDLGTIVVSSNSTGE
jgi:hypothetical protein